MAERPLYTLYKNLKAQNYDVPDDYNKFESALTRDGKGGADNRHAIYENLKAQNFDVPSTYERFYSALFEPRSKTSSRAKGGSVPMSAADRARFSAGAAAISASAQQTMNNAGRYNRLKQRKQKQQKDFGRVNLGTHQTPYGGDANNVVKDDFAYNPETDKSGAYVTSDNENVYSLPEAEQMQAILDKQNDVYQVAFNTGEIPSAFDVRDKNGNYDLQENIGKNGTYLTEEGAQKQFDKKLADAYARKKEIEAAIAEDHRLHGNPLLSYGASIGASNGRTAEQSDYSNKWTTSLALVKQQIGALEAVKQYPTSSWGEDALKALDNTAFTAKTWDFGLTDFATMGQMERIKTKMDNNIPLSGSDKMLLKSKLGADAAAALEDEKMGNIYRWTKIAGQSLPFMADFFLTGGYGGITKGISRGALKFAAKRGMGKVSAAILKNTGIVAGDVIGSYAMAGTEQALKTGADIIQRHLGNLYQDEKGDYKFGTFDENGNLLHEGGESMGTALYKGMTSAMVENYTEKLFGHNYGIKKGAVNFMEKHGMNASAEFFKNIGKSGWYTNSKKWMEKFGINGFAEEVMEEEIGIPLHALLDGEGKVSDLLDAKQQLDIIGGMAISVGSMYAMGAGSRPVKGIYNRAQYYRFRNKVNVADSDAQNLMGDNWADIKDKIDNATNEQMGSVLADILRKRDTMTKEQINAAVNYGVNLMKMRGYNIAKTAEMNAKEITNEPTTPEEQHQADIDNAYSEGYDADDADKHDIQIQQEDQMKTLAAALGISEQQLSAMSDEELESLTGQDDKLDQAIYDYQLSSARYQGVVDDAQDKVDLAAHQTEQRFDMYTDQSRGSVRNATIKASGGLEDYGVYIISGNIATHDDGSIDVSNSDDMILYYDPTTNSVEHADALMFAELGEELPADDVKAQAVTDAKENAIKETAGIIDGTVEVGSQFNVNDTDGSEHTYEVLADYGDGTAAISIDGNVVENPYSLADLQQMKDLEDQKRLEAAKAEREQMEKERAAQQTQETEETQPSFDFNQILNDNGNVVLVDVLDKDGNTKYPDSRLFLIRDAGAKAKVVELKSDGTLVPHAVNKEDVATISSMSIDEYKQAMPESSMIEDNSGEESDEDSQLANLGLSKGSEIWMSGDGFGRPKENTQSKVVGIDEQGSIILEDKDGKKWSASFDYINNHRELPPLDENTNIVNEENNQSESNAEENTPAPEQTPAITLEDGTIVPMLEDGNPDFSKLTAAQTAELYDTQFGEDADSIVSGYVSDAKKALDKASNMTVKGKTFVEQKAAKDAKEKAIADAQAAYDSAVAIRDAYNERQLAKVEDTAEGRKELIEKARRKFARLKSAVKDDAEAVSQLYRDTIGSLLHRLYDGTGIDVTDTTPLTAEEYVASNLGAHSLNYEGTETSKGVKQETGLSREDFAKTQLLAADGKGTTIDALVHSLWENRPSNLESLDTQDIRNALIGVLNSGFKASEARNFVENIRIAQAENILEEQKRAQENAAYAEQHKAEPEAELKAKSDEKAELKAKLEAKLDNESSNESNDLSNESDNEKTNDKINDNINVPEDATDEAPLGAQRDESDLPFSAKENGKQQTIAERAADVEKNKVDDMKVVDNIVGQKTRKAFERLAKMMGANIQWQYSDKLGNGWIQETKDADGNVHRTIFITLDSSITEGSQFIFGHEMTHQIKNLNPAAYNELTQLVLDTYGSDAFDKAVDETMQRYSDAGFSGRARDYYAEEVVADSVGEMIRDLNLAHTLAMKMSHPLLAAIHEILQKIKLAFFGTEYSDVTKNIIRSIEQAYVKTAKGEVTNSETGEDVSFSLRQKPEPKKKGVGYKVFVLKDGKLYPPMVANPDGAATPVGVWLDADAAPIAGESKTGRPQVKQGGKGTQGGSGKLAYRPGWHLGVVPYAIQFNRKDAEGNKTLFPKNFVFAEVEYAADVDYQEEARQEGINPSGKYQHSLAGLKHLPTDGYYMYRTNPNPETDPWVITGAMKVNRILTRAEQAELVKNAGREPQQIQEGDIVTDDIVNSINQEIADAPKFSLKTYHGTGANFDRFDTSHAYEGAGSETFGHGIYVTKSAKIGASYALNAKVKKIKTPKAFKAIKNGDNWFGRFIDNAVRSSFAKAKKETFNRMDELIKEDENIVNDETKPEWKQNAAQKELADFDKLKSLFEGLTEEDIPSLKRAKANRYEVEIPDDTGNNYLDWNKPMKKEQKKIVREGLEKLGVDVDRLVRNGYSLDKNFGDVYNGLLYYALNGTKFEESDSFVASSNFLSSLGFTGIKYYAGTIWGGAKKGDLNYVIFNEDDAKIVGNTKFSLKKVNDAFNQRLDELVKNPNQKDKILRLGRSSSFLKAGGIADADIELEFDKFVRKSGDKYKNNHPFNASDLKNLPMAIAEPIAVFKSTNANDHVVLTELQKDGKNFIVAIRAVEQHRKGGVVLEVNQITSLYPKEEKGIINLVNTGRISNVDKEKALHFIEALQPHVGTSITDEELKSAANIINSFETTKENGEKVDSDGTKFSLKDEEYLKAVEDGNMEKAQKMVNEAADAAGYSTDSSYQGTSAFNGAAPWGNGYFLTKDERKEAWDNGEFEGESTLGDYINDDIDGGNLEELTNAASYRAADPMRKEAIDNVRNAIQKKAKTITMYRSVPSDVKEGSFRNGDWVTPSRAYAVDNAKLHGWGDDYNIIEQKVPVDDVWFDGNDIAEWGYGREEDYINDTDFAYKNTKNNKKLLDAVTYDDEGNVIPLSKRFNEKNKDVRFSLKDEKTLAGVHNISEEKLLKAIKQGGLANPSVAVIDSSKQKHEGYGDISLILPSDKVAKRTGKNAGTWQGDAYTPTYPQVEKQISNKGSVQVNKDVLSVPKEMQHEVRSGIDRWILDGNDSNSGLKYLFLHEKGNAPKMAELQHKYSDKVYNDLKFITAGDFNISSIGKADTQKVLDMYIDNVFGGDRAAYEEKQEYRIARYKKHVAEGEKNPFLFVRAKNALEQYDKYGFYFDKVQDFVRKVERDHRMTGVDTNATLNDVEDYIKTNNLTDEFNTWLEGKEKEYGIKEVIFDGFTPSGNRRYVPNTLENVSKIMKKQGRNGATGTAVSFQNFAARLMPSYGTLKDIRSKKGLLTSDREEFDKFREKWSNVFYELGMKCQPDATGTFDDYGLARLSEAAMTSDPQAYLKKEYNVDFSDEDTKRLKEMVKAIKEEHPAMYFETKFERPVRFDEFSAAVVPTTTKKEVKEALKNAGVSIFEYDEKNDADRSRAFNEAINSSDNIRFSLKSMMEKPEGWKQANKKAIHIAEAIERDPKFSIRTYHGTGASFDKFDLSHALEGEGSETFGHGVYVTNSSKIGREYAQRAKQRKMADLYKNMRYPDGVKGDIFKRRVFGEMVNDVATGGSVASAKDFAKKRVGADANDIQRTLENLKDREKGTEYEQNLKDRLAEYKDALKWIDSIDEDYLTQGNANRYDVDIPDDNGNYLGWNDSQNFPLEKWYRLWEITHHGFNENEYFKDGGARYDIDRIERITQMKLESPENGMQKLPTLKGEELYHALEDFFNRERPSYGAELASRALSEIGFVGIKYPAGLIHGGAKEGDYNYVIFDENNANIVGNTRFSLRYDKFEHDLNQWKKDNNLPKDAQRPTIPQRNAGESAVDFLRRVDEYRKQMALWKTAPTYEQHLLSNDTALGEFNRELQRGSVLKRIAFQDSMLAIRKAQEAIMKEVGVDRLNMAEDAYTAENRSHGKGKNEFEEYNNEFLQPLRKAYHQMKKILGDSYDNVRIYMMAKHGLERDAQMAFKKSLDADFEDVAQRSAAYRAYKGDMNRITNDSDLEFGRVDFNTWRQRDNALRTKYSPSYMDYRYDENGIAYDYSGLSALFGGSDFEEAAHKLVRDIEDKYVTETHNLWDATNAATKKILRDGYKAGMMSKDTYLYVRDMYSHYIPLRGWDGTTADQVWDYIGGGKGAFNQTLKKANGRTSIADDPIAYIENMAESGILLNNKNWVKQHLMLLAQNHPTSLLTLSKAWYVKSTDANGNEEWIPATPQITSQMDSNQVKAAIDAFEKKMEQMAQTGDATQKRDGLNIAYPQTHSEEREHEVRVMKDGEEYVIYVNGDPQLAQAMNNTRAHRVREIQSGKLDRAAAWLGRKMAAAYTSLSPLFIPSNYFRDLTMTLASTAIREDGRYNYLLRKNLATSWNLGFMLKDYQNGKLREKVSNGNATKKEQMFYDFMMNGGETGFVSSLDVEDLKKKFKNDLKDLDRWKANPVKVGHTIMDSIEFLNRMIEDSNRFAVYMTSIQYGRSIDEAVNDAKNVTLNFNRKGTGEHSWQTIRNLYLFINPAVQSLQTLGALAKHHPFKFTAVTASWIASGVLVPIVNAALMQMAAAFLGGDGDDDKDWYKDISKKYWQFTKWDRRNNFIMWVPTTHEFVKIPLAQEFRAFYGLGDMIASKMMGGELAEESWEEYAEDLMGQVVDMLPLDPTGYDGNIAVSLMPNAIRPVFELAFNVDFTGKPLFKDTEYNKYDPNFTKAYVGTPDWLVRASKMVNSIGNDYPDVQQNGIDAFGDPRYNLNNPAVVDHVLSSYLGGAYTVGSQVLGLLTKSLNDPKEIKVADIPLFSKFVSNPDDRPVTKKQGDEFWNMKENHDRAANTLSKLKKQAKVNGDYSMLERFYGAEEYKQYKQDDAKVKKYEEDKKKERAEESGEEYRPHKLNAEDIYKAHATPKDDFEDLKLKQLYTKLNGFKSAYDLLVDTAPSQSDGYYNTNKAAIDAIDEISLDKLEISELKKGFLDDGKDAYNAEDMKQIRELRKKILAVLEKANKVVVANQKAKDKK